MKNLILSLIALTSTSSFAAFPRVLNGATASGEPCSLTIESANFVGTWETILLTVRTSWQKAENPSLVAKASPSPFSLYAINKATFDQVAIDFEPSAAPNLNAIRSFLFQTWSKEGGVLQTYCRIAK